MRILVMFLVLLFSTAANALNKVDLWTYRDKMSTAPEDYILPDKNHMCHVWTVRPYKDYPMGVLYSISTPLDSDVIVDEVAYTDPIYNKNLGQSEYPFGWVADKPVKITSSSKRLDNVGHRDVVVRHQLRDGTWIEYSYYTDSSRKVLYSVQVHH